MYGLDVLDSLNERAAAKFQEARYIRIRNKAIRKEDWERAKQFDGWATDMRNFVERRISVYPNKKNRRKRRFTPAKGRDFSKAES